MDFYSNLFPHFQDHFEFRSLGPEYSLEGLMLMLKLLYFGQLLRRANSLEKTLMLGRLKAREDEMVGWHH